MKWLRLSSNPPLPPRRNQIDMYRMCPWRTSTRAWWMDLAKWSLNTRVWSLLSKKSSCLRPRTKSSLFLLSSNTPRRWRRRRRAAPSKSLLGFFSSSLRSSLAALRTCVLCVNDMHSKVKWIFMVCEKMIKVGEGDVKGMGRRKKSVVKFHIRWSKCNGPSKLPSCFWDHTHQRSLTHGPTAPSQKGGGGYPIPSCLCNLINYKHKNEEAEEDEGRMGHYLWA